MTVQSNSEWRVEEAFINALGENVDLQAGGIYTDAVPIIRALQDDKPIYPCIVVDCVGVQHPITFGGTAGIEEAMVEIFSYTRRKDDPTAELVGLALGAVRDQVRNTGFQGDLNTLVNFTCHGYNEEGMSRNIDNQNIRARSLTVRVLATLTDF